MRKLFILSAALMAGSAMAQMNTISLMHGDGAARDTNQTNAIFSLEGHRAIRSSANLPSVGGFFSCKLLGPSSASPFIQVEMRDVRVVTASGHTGFMAGNGTMVVQSNIGPIRIDGRIEVTVEDLGNPMSANPLADRLSFKVFRPNPSAGGGSSLAYQYSGGVVRGDIVVGSRNIGP